MNFMHPRSVVLKEVELLIETKGHFMLCVHVDMTIQAYKDSVIL